MMDETDSNDKCARARPGGVDRSIESEDQSLSPRDFVSQ